MASDMKLFSVDKFLGINEAADGYTELKMGEASRMENFAITDGMNITLRPGIRRLQTEADRGNAEILCVWAGFVETEEYLVVVDFHEGADRINLYAKDNKGDFYLEKQKVGALGLDDAENAMVKAFPFGGRLYIMCRTGIVCYTNGDFQNAEIYVPLVLIGTNPQGGGDSLENLNMLTHLRRVEYNADGTAKTFVLPSEATGVSRILIDNVEYAVGTAGKFDSATHSFQFNNAPSKGVSNVEITYTTDPAATEETRLRLAKMALAETYNGATDTRLFLAGDGTNICFYSGVGQNGDVNQLYFPAMNEVAVDMSASPVTGLKRHYSKLVVFKPDGAFTITYEPVSLADGSTIAGFYLRAANREFGNDCMGQVQTVENYPRTLSKSGIYEWRITSSYSRDERYAVRVSDRAEKTLSEADVSKVITCDDNHSKTYYVFLNDEEGTVLANRYALTKDGVWCVYKSKWCVGVTHAVMRGNIMVIAAQNQLFYFEEGAAYDAPETEGGEQTQIKAVWESGYMDFGADFRQKYSSKIYVSMLPQFDAAMTVTAATDRRERYIEKGLGLNLFSFNQVDFGSFSFETNSTPKIQRVRLKVKKFVYYKLIFKVDQPGARATVLSYDQEVRFGSMAKR